MSRPSRVKIGRQDFLTLVNRSDGIYHQFLFLFTPGIDRVERSGTTVVQPRNAWKNSNALSPSGDPVSLSDGEGHLCIVVGIILREIWRGPHITKIEQSRTLTLVQSR